MITSVIILFFLIIFGFIVWALDKGYEVELAIIQGFFIGGLYDKDENDSQYLHTIQFIFVVLSISILWETDK